MNVLLLGCGSKFGLTILKSFLSTGANVYSLSGSELDFAHDNLEHTVINWRSPDTSLVDAYLGTLPQMDIVFFNQKSSSVNERDFAVTNDNVNLWKLEYDWAQSYFTNSILPFHIVRTLGSRCTPTTKIAWMLSSVIYNHSNTQNLGYADYCGSKFQNYVIMQNFALHHHSCFFGLDPDNLDSPTITPDSIVDEMLLANITELNGTVRFLDLTVTPHFKMFKGNATREITMTETVPAVVLSPAETSAVSIEFEISDVNGTMTLEINNQVFENLKADKFVYDTAINFPSTLDITISGKGPNDTVISDGKIVADKCVILSNISVNGSNVDSNYLMQFIQLHTDTDVITSNYWGFNGTASINFDSPNGFDWLIDTKNRLESYLSNQP